MILEARRDEVLTQVAAEYQAKGYIVERDQHLEDGGEVYEVDLLARSGDDVVLIELTGTGATQSALRRFAELAERKSWRFVILVVDAKNHEEVEVPSPEAIRAKLTEARAITPSSTAAPLLAWSVLEAAARLALARSGRKVVRSRTPTALVQDLAALGLVSRNEEQLLNRFAKARNGLAHGFWDTSPADADVSTTLDLAQRLVDDNPKDGQG